MNKNYLVQHHRKSQRLLSCQRQNVNIVSFLFFFYRLFAKSFFIYIILPSLSKVDISLDVEKILENKTSTRKSNRHTERGWSRQWFYIAKYNKLLKTLCIWVFCLSNNSMFSFTNLIFSYLSRITNTVIGSCNYISYCILLNNSMFFVCRITNYKEFKKMSDGQ